MRDLSKSRQNEGTGRGTLHRRKQHRKPPFWLHESLGGMKSDIGRITCDTTSLYCSSATVSKAGSPGARSAAAAP